MFGLLAGFIALLTTSNVVFAQEFTDNPNNITLCGLSDFYNSTVVPYSFNNNKYGDDGSGYSCISILDGGKSFYVNFSWAGLPGSVKAFPYVKMDPSHLPVQLWNVSALNFSGEWSMVVQGTENEGPALQAAAFEDISLKANVAMDMFLSDNSTESTLVGPPIEIMIWFWYVPAILPLGYDTSTPEVDSVFIAGTNFSLYHGSNGQGQHVYSWLAGTNLTSTDADYAPLLKYLWDVGYLNGSLYLGQVEFGTEVMHAGGATNFTASNYTLELFRQSDTVNSSAANTTNSTTTSSSNTTKKSLATANSIPGKDSFHFIASIDGVLLRSSKVIPGASESLTYLQRNNVPFILLTNGGGKTESQRTDDLNAKLSLPSNLQIHVSQLVQSHTPFSEYATTHGVPSYKNSTILVVGGDYDRCRHVAETYGFTNVVTSADIFAAYPETWPFSRNFKEYYSQFTRPLPRPINLDDPSNSLKIDAIFIYSDPRDWGLDIQLILDIMLSKNGIIGTYSEKNGKKELDNYGYQSDGQPPIYFSNPDLLWASAHPQSRLGQGGFREALDGVWRAVTRSACGEEIAMKRTIIGKPHQLTYEYAEKVLIKHREQAFGKDVQEREKLRKVYMIGDNPESDIMGANNYKSRFGSEWISVLTKTGVFRARPGEEPTVKPKIIVDDVREGVRWALKQSGWNGEID